MDSLGSKQMRILRLTRATSPLSSARMKEECAHRSLDGSFVPMCSVKLNQIKADSADGLRHKPGHDQADDIDAALNKDRVSNTAQRDYNLARDDGKYPTDQASPIEEKLAAVARTFKVGQFGSFVTQCGM